MRTLSCEIFHSGRDHRLRIRVPWPETSRIPSHTHTVKLPIIFHALLPRLIHNSESLPKIMRIVYVVALTIGLLSPAYAVPRPISVFVVQIRGRFFWLNVCHFLLIQVPIENTVGSLQARGPSKPPQPEDVGLYVSYTGVSKKKASEEDSQTAADTVQGYLNTIYNKRAISFAGSTFYFFQDNERTVRFTVMDPMGQRIESLGITCGTLCRGGRQKETFNSFWTCLWT